MKLIHKQIFIIIFQQKSNIYVQDILLIYHVLYENDMMLYVHIICNYMK